MLCKVPGDNFSTLDNLKRDPGEVGNMCPKGRACNPIDELVEEDQLQVAT